MSRLITALLLSTGLMMVGSAGAQTTSPQASQRQAMKAEMEKVDATYKAAKERCDSLKGNAEDVCEAEAKAQRDIAKADLEASNRNTADARRDASRKKAEAEYDVAKERCDDLAGNVKDVCVKDAKAALERAKASAKSMS